MKLNAERYDKKSRRNILRNKQSVMCRFSSALRPLLPGERQARRVLLPARSIAAPIAPSSVISHVTYNAPSDSPENEALLSLPPPLPPPPAPLSRRPAHMWVMLAFASCSSIQV